MTSDSINKCKINDEILHKLWIHTWIKHIMQKIEREKNQEKKTENLRARLNHW